MVDFRFTRITVSRQYYNAIYFTDAAACVPKQKRLSVVRVFGALLHKSYERRSTPYPRLMTRHTPLTSLLCVLVGNSTKQRRI